MLERVLRSDVTKDGLLVFAAMMGANVLTYIFYATSSRALGVEAAGVFTALLSAMLIFSLPATIAAVVVAKIAADRRAAGRPDALRAFGLRLTVTAAGTAAGIVALVALLREPIASYFHVPDSGVIVIAGIGFSFTFALPLQRSILQGGGAFDSFAISNLVEGTGKAAVGAVLIASGIGITGALGGYAVAVAVAFAVNALLLSRRFGRRSGAIAIAPRELSEHAVNIALPIGAITVMTFVDVILVRHYFGARDAGLYGAAALVGRALLTIIAFIPAVLLPKATERLTARRSLIPLLVSAIAVTLLLSGAALTAIILAPERVIGTIAGPAFKEGAWLLLGYCYAMSALAVATVLSSYLIGVGHRGFATPLAVIAAAEVLAVVLHHPDLATVLHIVVAGHSTACLCTALATAHAVGRLLSGRIAEPQVFQASTSERHRL